MPGHVRAPVQLGGLLFELYFLNGTSGKAGGQFSGKGKRGLIARLMQVLTSESCGWIFWNEIIFGIPQKMWLDKYRRTPIRQRG